jgi:hypothetical protein
MGLDFQVKRAGLSGLDFQMAVLDLFQVGKARLPGRPGWFGLGFQVGKAGIQVGSKDWLPGGETGLQVGIRAWLSGRQGWTAGR